MFQLQPPLPPPPPPPIVGNVRSIVIPNKMSLIKLPQLDKFIEQINTFRSCNIPECRGNLVPVDVDSVGKGGGGVIKYACDGCAARGAVLETFSQYKVGANTISHCVQVQFVISACTHATYHKVLKLSQALNRGLYLKTIEEMFPIVKGILDQICKNANKDMKAIPDIGLGSWKRAVTTADGTWQTRGWPSKSATFTYLNRALLYYRHSCQKGKTDVVGEELYLGTFKSAEGYAAKLMFEKAKEDEMNIEIH